MTYFTASHIETDRTQGGIAQAVTAFITAWFETSAAYTACKALSTLSNSELAARGLRREDLGRVALDLPAARK